MSNRTLFAGVPTVEVDMSRYDELLHKEAQLESILRFVTNNTVLTTDHIWAIVGVKKEEDTDG